MTIVITIIYVIVSLFMVLVILLQAGKGGGMGTALGGGASQSVFGGGGGADFMAKLTQGCAAAFVLCAVYLAYVSAHSGSDFLKGKSQDLAAEKNLADEDDEINYERLGRNPQLLPPADAEPNADEPKPSDAVVPPTVDTPTEGDADAVGPPSDIDEDPDPEGERDPKAADATDPVDDNVEPSGESDRAAPEDTKDDPRADDPAASSVPQENDDGDPS